MILYEKNGEPAIIFYSVPKSASTTLSEYVYNFLSKQDRFRNFRQKGITGNMATMPLDTVKDNMEKLPNVDRFALDSGFGKFRPTSLLSKYTNIQPGNPDYILDKTKMQNRDREVIFVTGLSVPQKPVHRVHGRTVFMGLENFKNCFKVLNVRNPYDRLFSTYKHIQRERGPKCAYDNSMLTNEFDVFLENYHCSLIVNGKQQYIRDIPQHAFCFTGGNHYCDYTIRAENFEEDLRLCFSKIKDRFNIDYTLPHIRAHNVFNKKGSYKHAYRQLSDYHLELAYEICREDAEIFGYELDLS